MPTILYGDREVSQGVLGVLVAWALAGVAISTFILICAFLQW